jgi:L-threonylcarbamoyladenylate synthase
MIIKEKMLQDIMIVNCDKEGIEKAANIINHGGIAVFPTDTVYGIGCNPYNKTSVEKIYKIKSRNISKSLPVLTYSIDTAEKIVEFDKKTRKIVEKFWPGPLTLILNVTDEKIKESLQLEDKIAIRVPNHKCTLELLKKCDYIVGTSANVSGSTSFTNPQECMKNVRGQDIFLDGGLIHSQGESTIIEIVNEEIKIIREGSLTKGEILQI